MQAIIGTDPAEAARRLAAGELVALPTETVYGLGGNALDQTAVANIFQAKNRPRFDPLILHQSDADRILRYARHVPAAARLLADACWPGPLTLVLERVKTIPDLVTSGLDTVALRVPDHPLTREVLGRLDFPVAAPSANPFGYVSPVTATHVADQLGERVDYILDGGPCAVGLESTIVTFAPDGTPVVLRKGGTPVEALEALLQRPVTVRTHGSSRPEAPGMLLRHYAPGLSLLLVESSPGPGTPERAVVRFGEAAKNAYEYSLSESGNLEEAAHRLFHTLRQLDAAGFGEAVVQTVPERGLGLAINDRLRRAAR
ncbi:translation factor SUA5 [Neolewinella xylanilytica]|uniref:Threonylcarbamoyl-AMP synthase n=1 Tax=Neolewinella xylanilytica TaxID=1514080 RepID=A0A2S6I3Z3_9BACT|nr:L-threonylcarbamoyladenylate synthase [Neolewinella xylanilytica]PPK85779.1 translation factor SUA5 [Neolewinella xylanilytica]